MKPNMNILYFAPIYYDDMKQRPQQIAECLARKHKVCYVEPTVSFVRWLLKGGRAFSGMTKKQCRGVKVIRLNGCMTLHKSIEILDLFGINSWSECMQLRKLIKECDVVWVGYSGWYTVVSKIQGKKVVFDKMDEEDLLVSSRIWRLTLKRNKEKLEEMADVIFAASGKIYKEVHTKGKKAFLIPNAVSDHFASQLTDTEVDYAPMQQIKVF